MHIYNDKTWTPGDLAKTFIILFLSFGKRNHVSFYHEKQTVPSVGFQNLNPISYAWASHDYERCKRIRRVAAFGVQTPFLRVTDGIDKMLNCQRIFLHDDNHLAVATFIVTVEWIMNSVFQSNYGGQTHLLSETTLSKSIRSFLMHRSHIRFKCTGSPRFS